ncbi:EVI5-like protein [Phytophthora cinnamomi]|uniref:EVI5-like protein n=1 Tax=Phytophthora cinnamomi TaxID=4785 RepID=UPI00355A7780|nr:EVI5-like protein [Phytophthora cinnamomi]
MMLEKGAAGPEDTERSAVREKSDADRETLAPSSPDGEEAKAEETETKALAVAFPMAPIDRYGFLVTDKRYNGGQTSPNAYKHAVWLENRRTQKWVKMIGKQLEDWEVCQLRHAGTLKKRIRKGIPEALRGRVWSHLAGSSQMLLNNPGVYHQLLQTARVPCEETIARDIGRTFPRHSLFRDRSSLGQCALMNVLKAYSLHDPEVGYCQGMGFLSAMFLCYMPEQQAFWLLVACLNHKRYGLADLYRPRMPKVPEVTFVFQGLFKQIMPQLSTHLENEGLHPTMYLTQWFLTLFTYNFPFEFVTRVWDAFLHEGWKVIYRAALALLKVSQKTLLSSKFETIMEYFRDLPNKVDTDEVLTAAFRLPIKRSQIAHLLEEYHSSSAAS